MSQRIAEGVTQQSNASLMNFNGLTLMEKGERRPRLQQNAKTRRRGGGGGGARRKGRDISSLSHQMSMTVISRDEKQLKQLKLNTHTCVCV